MQPIAEWRASLGISEYAQSFAENDIDTSVLRDLTDQDLKDIGISPGHRRRLLRAIAELAGTAPTPPQPAAAAAAPPQDSTERRQLTSGKGVRRGAVRRSLRARRFRWQRQTRSDLAAF